MITFFEGNSVIYNVTCGKQALSLKTKRPPFSFKRLLHNIAYSATNRGTLTAILRDHPDIGWPLGRTIPCLCDDTVAGGHGIVVEHLDSIQRVLVEILTDQRQFFQNVISSSDNVATDRVGLKDIEQLTRACPD